MNIFPVSGMVMLVGAVEMTRHHANRGHLHHRSGDDGKFVHPRDCTRYYHCHNTRCRPKRCPRGQMFVTTGYATGHCQEGDVSICHRVRVHHTILGDEAVAEKGSSSLR